MDVLLNVSKLRKSFGGLEAFKDISFSVFPHEFIGLMGPNGAGKTTLVNVLTGDLPPTEGTIHYCGEIINRYPPDKIRKLGLARTYQIPRAFGRMTVFDNVLTAARYGGKMKLSAAAEQVKKTLQLVGLLEKGSAPAGELQFADLRLLELARALVTKPKLIFIDEVAAGLPDSEIPRVLNILNEIRKMNIAVVIIEHVIKVLVEVVDRIIVLDMGSIICDDCPQDVMENQNVIEAYLGEPQ